MLILLEGRLILMVLTRRGYQYTSDTRIHIWYLKLNFLNFKKSQILKLHIQALMEWRLWHLLYRIRLAIAFRLLKSTSQLLYWLSLFVNLRVSRFRILEQNFADMSWQYLYPTFSAFWCINCLDLSLSYHTCIHASCWRIYIMWCPYDKTYHFPSLLSSSLYLWLH